MRAMLWPINSPRDHPSVFSVARFTSVIVPSSRQDTMRSSACSKSERGRDSLCRRSSAARWLCPRRPLSARKRRRNASAWAASTARVIRGTRPPPPLVAAS